MKYFLLLSIISIIFISGCTQKAAASTFNNNVVTIEDFSVSASEPYSGSTVNIAFDIKNNGDKTVPRVTVNFFDTPGFTSLSLECGGLASSDKTKCEFTNLDSLDNKRVSIALKTAPISSPTTFTVSISVDYDYSGSIEATIPVIDTSIIKKPSPNHLFSQSQPSIGPVVFEIQPLLREKVVDDKTVTENWAAKNEVIVTKFILKNVGNIPNTHPVSIPAGKVKFTLTNLQAVSCSNFDSSGMSQKTVSESLNTLICNFKPISDQSEFSGIIKLNYDYTYEYIKGVDFEIKPEPK